LVTFYTSKIMLATKLRGALHDKPNRCNVFYLLSGLVKPKVIMPPVEVPAIK
jgi:hypothetical protein